MSATIIRHDYRPDRTPNIVQRKLPGAIGLTASVDASQRTAIDSNLNGEYHANNDFSNESSPSSSYSLPVLLPPRKTPSTVNSTGLPTPSSLPRNAYAQSTSLKEYHDQASIFIDNAMTGGGCNEPYDHPRHLVPLHTASFPSHSGPMLTLQIPQPLPDMIAEAIMNNEDLRSSQEDEIGSLTTTRVQVKGSSKANGPSRKSISEADGGMARFEDKITSHANTKSSVSPGNHHYRRGASREHEIGAFVLDEDIEMGGGNATLDEYFYTQHNSMNTAAIGKDFDHETIFSSPSTLDQGRKSSAVVNTNTDGSSSPSRGNPLANLSSTPTVLSTESWRDNGTSSYTQTLPFSQTSSMSTAHQRREAFSSNVLIQRPFRARYSTSQVEEREAVDCRNDLHHLPQEDVKRKEKDDLLEPLNTFIPNQIDSMLIVQDNRGDGSDGGGITTGHAKRNFEQVSPSCGGTPPANSSMVMAMDTEQEITERMIVCAPDGSTNENRSSRVGTENEDNASEDEDDFSAVRNHRSSVLTKAQFRHSFDSQRFDTTIPLRSNTYSKVATTLPFFGSARGEGSRKYEERGAASISSISSSTNLSSSNGIRRRNSPITSKTASPMPTMNILDAGDRSKRRRTPSSLATSIDREVASNSSAATSSESLACEISEQSTTTKYFAPALGRFIARPGVPADPVLTADHNPDTLIRVSQRGVSLNLSHDLRSDGGGLAESAVRSSVTMNTESNELFDATNNEGGGAGGGSSGPSSRRRLSHSFPSFAHFRGRSLSTSSTTAQTNSQPHRHETSSVVHPLTEHRNSPTSSGGAPNTSNTGEDIIAPTHANTTSSGTSFNRVSLRPRAGRVELEPMRERQFDPMVAFWREERQHERDSAALERRGRAILDEAQARIIAAEESLRERSSWRDGGRRSSAAATVATANFGNDETMDSNEQQNGPNIQSELSRRQGNTPSLHQMRGLLDVDSINGGRVASSDQLGYNSTRGRRSSHSFPDQQQVQDRGLTSARTSTIYTSPTLSSPPSSPLSPSSRSIGEAGTSGTSGSRALHFLTNLRSRRPRLSRNSTGVPPPEESPQTTPDAVSAECERENGWLTPPLEWDEENEIAEARRLTERLQDRRTLAVPWQTGSDISPSQNPVRAGTRDGNARDETTATGPSSASDFTTLWASVEDRPEPHPYSRTVFANTRRMRGPTERANELWRLGHGPESSAAGQEIAAMSSATSTSRNLYRNLANEAPRNLQFHAQPSHADPRLNSALSAWRASVLATPAGRRTGRAEVPPSLTSSGRGEVDHLLAVRSFSPSPHRERLVSEGLAARTDDDVLRGMEEAWPLGRQQSNVSEHEVDASVGNSTTNSSSASASGAILPTSLFSPFPLPYRSSHDDAVGGSEERPPPGHFNGLDLGSHRSSIRIEPRRAAAPESRSATLRPARPSIFDSHDVGSSRSSQADPFQLNVFQSQRHRVTPQAQSDRQRECPYPSTSAGPAARRSIWDHDLEAGRASENDSAGSFLDFNMDNSRPMARRESQNGHDSTRFLPSQALLRAQNRLSPPIASSIAASADAEPSASRNRPLSSRNPIAQRRTSLADALAHFGARTEGITGTEPPLRRRRTGVEGGMTSNNNMAWGEQDDGDQDRLMQARHERLASFRLERAAMRSMVDGIATDSEIGDFDAMAAAQERNRSQAARRRGLGEFLRGIGSGNGVGGGNRLGAFFDEDFAFFRRDSAALDPRNYLDDDEFDTSYESLLRLSERLGDVKPKGVPASTLSTLKVFKYKHWPRLMLSEAVAEGAEATTSAIVAEDEVCSFALAVKGIDKEERCAVCLMDYEEDDEIMLGHCDHGFHGKCLTAWLKTSNLCPLCRRDHT